MTDADDLGALIDRQITFSGPITIAAYMTLCLSHASKGYYRAARPIGAGGDFITAPEISQMFGELIGAWVANLWHQMGAPGEVALLELGPGHGTLMVDALRTASRVQGFADALELHLYDSHADLRARQAETLVGFNPRWTEDIVPQGDLPLIVVANEFFDALPIRQFVKSGKNWHERVIGLSEGQRRFGLDPVPVPETSLPKPLHGATDGSVFETSPAAANIMSELATAIATRGGAILAIDYGYHHTRAGETLQAVRHHAYADPLADPGNVDLSAHVDFSVLGNEAARAGLTVQPLAMQSDFLARLGIHRRAQNLAQASPADADEIAAATARLTAADAMGTLFKVFCAASPGLLPPGFQE